MTIKNFAEERGVNATAVAMYLSRYEEKHPDFKRYNDGTKDFTDECLRVLDEQYPLPKPVEIYNHDPDDLRRIKDQGETINTLVKRNDALVERMSGMQDRLDEQQKQIAAADAERLRIESHDQQISAELEEQKRRTKKAEEERDALRAELAAERKKPWFKKLFGLD